MTNALVEVVARKFKRIEAAVAAIGDRRRIDYMVIINGLKDRRQRFAFTAGEMRVRLEELGFNVDRGDTVLVWLPSSEDSLITAHDPSLQELGAKHAS